MRTLLISALTALTLAACGGGEKAASTAEETAAQTSAGDTPSSAPTTLPAGDPMTPKPPSMGTKKTDGDTCVSSIECQSGICEGKGCDGSGAVCVTAERMCTKDLVPYCGCDGQTFETSGSCAGRPYAHKGPCKPQADQ